MTWNIEWRDIGTGTAEHAATSATFKMTRGGWLSAIDAGSASEADLQRLKSELVVLLSFSQIEASMPDPRLLH